MNYFLNMNKVFYLFIFWRIIHLYSILMRYFEVEFSHNTYYNIRNSLINPLKRLSINSFFFKLKRKPIILNKVRIIRVITIFYLKNQKN